MTKVIFITYDYKNIIEKLKSTNVDFFHLNDSIINTNSVSLNEKVKHEVASAHRKNLPIKLKCGTKKVEYLKNVIKIKGHIQQGDIYEMSYCIEFYAENVEIEPKKTYKRLVSISPTPHQCYLEHEGIHLLCASPERFLKKVGNRLISQPIKGTAPRGKTPEEDVFLKSQLKNSAKNISENTMIVDLVRNDFSKIAKKASVKVDELCEVYTFPQVHQMISTVSCELRDSITFEEIIHATFPMGSMTGAPKVRAMQLIEEFETTKRGLYSGTVGIIQENGDFDLNVVIRSILYNEKNKYLSFMVGGAITIESDPEEEWQECLLKAKAIFETLGVSDEDIKRATE